MSLVRLTGPQWRALGMIAMMGDVSERSKYRAGLRVRGSTLRVLEALGLLARGWRGERGVFVLTPKGRRVLAGRA